MDWTRLDELEITVARLAKKYTDFRERYNMLEARLNVLQSDVNEVLKLMLARENDGK